MIHWLGNFKKDNGNTIITLKYSKDIHEGNSNYVHCSINSGRQYQGNKLWEINTLEITVVQ